MGKHEEGKCSKSEKSSSPATVDKTNQINIHGHPDWAAMQAYYGRRVTLPPYYNPTVTSGHAPHPYMWGTPQPVMPPYGASYAAIYPHGGVYAHPAVPLAVSPLSTETPTKSGNTDRGLMKKLKEFDGLAMSIGNSTAESSEDGAEHRLSQSLETEGSSDGNATRVEANQARRKRSREGTPTTDCDGKIETQASPVSAKDVNAAPDKALCAIVTPSSVVSPGLATSLEPRNTTNMNSKTITTGVLLSCTNDRELKRERRKQSNRESARRSRLKKQAEAEELARKVESLTAENASIRSEIDRVTEHTRKLRLENVTLMEKLKNAQLGQTEEIILNSIDNKTLPVSTENLLSRVNNSGSIVQSTQEKSDMYENSSKSGAKLHQLLDASTRANAVAAA